MWKLFGGNKGQNQLTKVMTPGYDSTDVNHDPALYGLHGERKRPLFRRLYHAPLMMEDPRIRLGMEAACGVICSMSRFYVDEGNEEEQGDIESTAGESDIKKFVKDQITRWWRTSAEQMLQAMVYGWYSAEVMYREASNGQTVFHYLKDIAPRDSRPYVDKDGNLVGIVIQRGVSGEIDRNLIGETYIGGMKKLWHVHQRQTNRWWGRSRLRGAWDPWLDLHDDNGILDVRALAYYQHLLDNEVLYCPMGGNIDPNSGREIGWKGVARDMLSQARAGAKFIFESNPDPNTGLESWRFEERKRTSSVADIKDAIEGLREEEIEGLGIPQEVIKAASTGSGYSGRKIPETAFHGLLQGVVFWMVHDFDEQCIRPLVRHNFGIEPDYEVIPFGLVQEEDDEEEDGDFNPGNNFRGGNKPGGMKMSDPAQRDAVVPRSARLKAKLQIAV